MNEMSFLLPHLLKDGRGKLDVYFTRVYNPVWTNPDGFSWIEALTDESLVGLHVALTPTWSETAFFADYVLPMGHRLRAPRHPLLRAVRRPVDRLPPAGAARRAASGSASTSTTRARSTPARSGRRTSSGSSCSWRIDPDGALGIRRHFESRERPGEKLTVDEYYRWIFEHSVPGLPERAAQEGLTPLEYMRRYGAFEVARDVGAAPRGAGARRRARRHRGRPVRARLHRAPTPRLAERRPAPDARSRRRRAAGRSACSSTATCCAASRRPAAGSSSTRARSPTGAGRSTRCPTTSRATSHPDRLADDQLTLISTFRLPVQIHTRSGNAKWLDEIAHTNPLWMHPARRRAARRRARATSCASRPRSATSSSRRG